MVGSLPFPCDTAYFNFLTYKKKEILENDTQGIGILFGKVGSGKSCRAQEILYFANREDCKIDQICFDKQELIKAVTTYKKKCIIIDEGTSVVFSREAMTREGRMVAALMAQIRAQNLLICICIPRLKDIESSVLEAADFAIMVYETKAKNSQGKMVTLKGNMRLWANMPHDHRYSKLVKYILMKKRNPFAWATQPPPNFTQKGQEYKEGLQTGFYAVPEADYREKKFSILKKYIDLKPKEQMKTIDYSKVDTLLDQGKSCFDIAKELGISEVSARTRKRQRKE
jgi:hypothetical protein